MFSQKAGKKIVTQFDTMQSHVLCLSLSSICINLTFSNLPLPFPVSSCRSPLAWMSAESMHGESGAYYGSPWMHFLLKGDRHAALKHGLLWFGDQRLLFAVNYF